MEPNAATVVVKVVAGSKIRERREAIGLTQEALGQLVGTSREMVNAWETGKVVPGGAMLGKLAVALRCTVDDLYLTQSRSTD